MNNDPYDRPDAPDRQVPEQAPRRVMLRPLAPNPWVTYALIGICVVVFLLQIGTQSLLGQDLPAKLGIKDNTAIINGEFWRLFTPMFLHGGLLHIAFNMYALYVIGRGLEQHYGHMRYLVLYIVAGFAGNTFSFLLNPKVLSLGASTSIFGLMSAEAIFIYQNRELFGKTARSMLTNILVLMVINLAIGYSVPGIDYWGHLGGLLGGAVFAWFAGPTLMVRAESYGYQLVDQRGMSRVWITALVEVIILSGLVYQYILLHPPLS